MSRSITSGEGNGIPLQYSCLENPMDGGAWGAAVHGVAKSRTLLSDFTFTFTFMHWRRKWQPTPVFLPGESQGRGSLVAAVYGVAQSQTQLKRLSSNYFKPVVAGRQSLEISISLRAFEKCRFLDKRSDLFHE